MLFRSQVIFLKKIPFAKFRYKSQGRIFPIYLKVSKYFLFFQFFVDLSLRVWVFCLQFAYAPCACLVAMEVRRGHGSLGIRDKMIVSNQMDAQN